jgi:DNA-binding MarR family transcriptional regulator
MPIIICIQMPADQLLELITKLSHSLTDRLDAELNAQLNLAYTHYQILFILSKYPDGSNQEQLVKELNVDKSTVSRQLRNKALRGLISRRQSSDSGREKHVQLTAAGHQKLVAAKVIVNAQVEELFQSLNKYEQKQFQIWLRALLGALS